MFGKHVAILVLALVGLCGCTTNIEYSQASSTDALTAGSLLFQLQDSMITLNRRFPSRSSDAPQSNCPKGRLGDEDWLRCLQGTTAAAVMSPVEQAAHTGKDASWQRIYLAKPDNGFFVPTTTTLAGSPVAGQDYLYDLVTIKYTNNVGTIITGAGTGAVAGFGIGGPPGAVAGALTGAILANPNLHPNSVPGGKSPSKKQLHLSLDHFVCPADRVAVDLVASAKATLKRPLPPALSLPVVIKAGDARPYGNHEAVRYNKNKGNHAGCWHMLPNAIQSGVIRAAAAGTPSAQDAGLKGGAEPKPAPGDGWLYRIVARDPIPAGTETADAYFASSKVRHSFPYSFCRQVDLQVTWWKELSNAIHDTNLSKEGLGKGGKLSVQPGIVTFSQLLVAEPDYVSIADVTKGAAINFRLDCGATISADVDGSNAGVINAAVTQFENFYSAEHK
jgi:hypothetical protein